MRHFLAVGALFLFAVVVLGQTGQPKPLTQAEAEAAFAKADRIKPGMTLAQAWKAVGLRRAPQIGRCSGPTSRYLMTFDLSEKLRFGMTVDCTKKPRKIVTIRAVRLRY